MGQFSMQYAVAMVDNVGYIFGGRVGTSTTSRSPAYKFVDGQLTAIRNLPKALSAHAAVAIGRKIYLVGGCVALVNGQENKQVIIYDVDTDTYSTGTDCPVAAVLCSATAVGTDIYVYGGLSNQNETGNPALFYKYNTLTNTWTALPFHGGNPWYAASITAFGTKLYAYGGEYQNAGIHESDVRIFDTVAGTWSLVNITGLKPGGRSGHVVKYDSGHFVAIGGRTAAGVCSNEAWVFDINALTWAKLPNYPSNIGFQAMLLFGRTINVFDGYSGTGIQAGLFTLE